MPSTLLRIFWYALMILSTAGLLALDIYTHDSSSFTFIVLGIAVILVNTISKTITVVKWMLEKKVVEMAEPENQTPQVHEPELTAAELLERKYARIRAENKLKDISASKAGELAQNKK